MKLDNESELQYKYFKVFAECENKDNDQAVADAINKKYDKNLRKETIAKYRKDCNWDSRFDEYEYVLLKKSKEDFEKKQMKKLMDSIEKTDEMLEKLEKEFENEPKLKSEYASIKNKLLLAKQRDLKLLNEL